MQFPEAKDIEFAQQSIKSGIHRTPILQSESISDIAGCQIFFKCENFQKVGAFKMRGALFALQQLTKEEKTKGVVTHSSGNHAQAVARAAKQLGIKAYIIMPENAPKVKVAAVKNYGGEISFCPPNLEARESGMKTMQAETGAGFIPPYDHFNIICGQATAAKELIEVTQKLDAILCPVGGGGLLAGSALAAKYFGKSKVYGTEPAAADDAYQSFRAGKFIPQNNPQTIADGLRTSLGELNFAIINNYVQDILTVEEDAIVVAMRLIWERMKIIVEPSAAVPLAAVLSNKTLFAKQKVGIIISGGNVDLDDYFEKLSFSIQQ
jgi:threonine dehydratase